MDLLKKFMGGGGPAAQSPIPAAEDDFADFAAGAPDPSPAMLTPSAAPVSQTLSASAVPTSTAIPLDRPFTKWYRVWERVYISDFYAELCILPVLLVLVFVHLWGSRKNRRKAKGWLAAHGPVLKQEFATVGFSGRELPETNFNVGDAAIPAKLLREKAGNEYVTYASGRQNVAFVDVKLSLHKRYNPVGRLGEEIIGFFIDSMPAPKERMEATCYPFDGKENELVSLNKGPEGSASKIEKFNSTYDGFVWAIVHKDSMQRMRDARYDLSLTSTKDHQKLPIWATVMSENAEITETLLTPQLVQAVQQCDGALESLIISDQPIDQPKSYVIPEQLLLPPTPLVTKAYNEANRLNETLPKKIISMTLRLPSGTDASTHDATMPLFTYFLRLADVLVTTAHFRPEVMRRIKATREEEMRKIKKLDETEKADERREKTEKDKKKARDDKLRGLTPDEQRKFLEKERAQNMRKTQKSKTMRS